MKRRRRQLGHPVERRQVHLGRVAGGQVGWQPGRLPGQRRARQRTGGEGEGVARRPHEAFLPGLSVPLEPVHGHRVRQLVADEQRRRGGQFLQAVYPAHAVAVSGEAPPLDGLIARIGFDDPVGGVRVGEDVLGELAVVRRLLNDREVRRTAEGVVDLPGQFGEQAAVQRSDAHRRVEIAAAADPARAGAVVAMLGMVEGQVHDVREGQTAVRGVGELIVQDAGERGHGKPVARSRGSR